MLLSKWHSSGEKLLLNHMQFKWNWNNNPCLKRSIALSYQTLQCVGCISHQRNTYRPGPALNYLSLIHNMGKKKTLTFGLKSNSNKKNTDRHRLTDTNTQVHAPWQHQYSAKRLLVRFRNLSYSHGSHYYFGHRVGNINLQESAEQTTRMRSNKRQGNFWDSLIFNVLNWGVYKL